VDDRQERQPETEDDANSEQLYSKNETTRIQTAFDLSTNDDNLSSTLVARLGSLYSQYALPVFYSQAEYELLEIDRLDIFEIVGEVNKTNHPVYILNFKFTLESYLQGEVG
jgi:hypothetical protein